MPNAPKRPNADKRKSGKSKKRKRGANQGWSITKVSTALAIAIAAAVEDLGELPIPPGCLRKRDELRSVPV